MALVSSDPLRECVEDMVQKVVRWRARRLTAETCVARFWIESGKGRRDAWGTKAVKKGNFGPW